jgi:hypothetical protein
MGGGGRSLGTAGTLYEMARLYENIHLNKIITGYIIKTRGYYD